MSVRGFFYIHCNICCINQHINIAIIQNNDILIFLIITENDLHVHNIIIISFIKWVSIIIIIMFIHDVICYVCIVILYTMNIDVQRI